MLNIPFINLPIGANFFPNQPIASSNIGKAFLSPFHQSEMASTIRVKVLAISSKIPPPPVFANFPPGPLAGIFRPPGVLPVGSFLGVPDVTALNVLTASLIPSASPATRPAIALGIANARFPSALNFIGVTFFSVLSFTRSDFRRSMNSLRSSSS